MFTEKQKNLLLLIEPVQVDGDQGFKYANIFPANPGW